MTPTQKTFFVGDEVEIDSNVGSFEIDQKLHVKNKYGFLVILGEHPTTYNLIQIRATATYGSHAQIPQIILLVPVTV